MRILPARPLSPPLRDRASLATEGVLLPDDLLDRLEARRLAPALHLAMAHAPYLRRLVRLAPSILEELAQSGVRATLEAINVRAVEAAGMEWAPALAHLRKAKRDLHLVLALGDLAGQLDLTSVTRGLSDFADEACRSALLLAARAGVARDELQAPAGLDRDNPVPGLFILAMGKHGAQELNYSSDIDVSFFYDPAMMPVGRLEHRQAAQRLVQRFVEAMEANTVDGYVFRTDLRLRPDPGATPPAVTINAAQHYYQHLGQNWERAAFIKARICAGDLRQGQDFLDELQSWVYRRALDFAAIADVTAIMRQIHSHGRHVEGDMAPDVKLGHGGIREIEFFVQTQQLVLGGRDLTLRTPQTLLALAALTRRGAVSEQAADALREAYLALRQVEHRIQMLEDEHTHKVPAAPAQRAALAHLCGLELESFDQQLAALRTRVRAIWTAHSHWQDALDAPSGSLVFTGVDDDPETLQTIRAMGFATPEQVSAGIRGLHHGRVRAMRTERAREILTRLTPRLLQELAATGEGDLAFRRFLDFMERLPAGVAALSLFEAKPEFLALIGRIFALSPKLAAKLGKRPALLDALMEGSFFAPLGPQDSAQVAAMISEVAHAARSYEAALDAVRRAHREETFRIGVHVLEGRADAMRAGVAFAALADAVIVALAPIAQAEIERLHGSCEGRWVALGLGKLGGNELADGSDLDIMFIYDTPPDARSTGPAGIREIGGVDYFTRLSQRLIAALSVPTAEGDLYEVDMQLRPSGKKGPLAVRISSFEHYYEHEAWTWELMALTRARMVAGDPALGARVQAAISAALGKVRDPLRLLADARDMRARLAKERPPAHFWDLKLTPGGQVDLEFIVQVQQLLLANGDPQATWFAATPSALEALSAIGRLTDEQAEQARAAHGLYASLTQLLRLLIADDARPETLGRGAQALLARAAGAPSFEQVAVALEAARGHVRALFEDLI